MCSVCTGFQMFALPSFRRAGEPLPVFYYKQEAAYEVRISDWSSDVGSSDLRRGPARSRCDRFLLGAGAQDYAAPGRDPPSAGLGRAGEGFGGIARTNNGAIFGKHLLHAGVIGNVERFRPYTRLPNAPPQPFHTLNVRRLGAPQTGKAA